MVSNSRYGESGTVTTKGTIGASGTQAQTLPATLENALANGWRTVSKMVDITAPLFQRRDKPREGLILD